MLPEGEMVSQFVPPLCMVVLATKVVVLGDDTVSCCVEEEPFTDVLKVSADVLRVNRPVDVLPVTETTTGMDIGLFPVPVPVTVRVAVLIPFARPAGFTVTDTAEGVLPELGETVTQLAEEETENATFELSVVLSVICVVEGCPPD